MSRESDFISAATGLAERTSGQQAASASRRLAEAMALWPRTVGTEPDPCASGVRRLRPGGAKRPRYEETTYFHRLLDAATADSTFTGLLVALEAGTWHPLRRAIVQSNRLRVLKLFTLAGGTDHGRALREAIVALGGNDTAVFDALLPQANGPARVGTRPGGIAATLAMAAWYDDDALRADGLTRAQQALATKGISSLEAGLVAFFEAVVKADRPSASDALERICQAEPRAKEEWIGPLRANQPLAAHFSAYLHGLVRFAGRCVGDPAWLHVPRSPLLWPGYLDYLSDGPDSVEPFVEFVGELAPVTSWWAILPTLHLGAAYGARFPLADAERFEADLLTEVKVRTDLRAHFAANHW